MIHIYKNTFSAETTGLLERIILFMIFALFLTGSFNQVFAQTRTAPSTVNTKYGQDVSQWATGYIDAHMSTNRECLKCVKENKRLSVELYCDALGKIMDKPISIAFFYTPADIKAVSSNICLDSKETFRVQGYLDIGRCRDSYGNSFVPVHKNVFLDFNREMTNDEVIQFLDNAIGKKKYQGTLKSSCNQWHEQPVYIGFDLIGLTKNINNVTDTMGKICYLGESPSKDLLPECDY